MNGVAMALAAPLVAFSEGVRSVAAAATGLTVAEIDAL